MVAYLTNNGFWIQLISNKGYVILQVIESLLNPCAQLDTRLHPGLGPEVGYILE